MTSRWGITGVAALCVAGLVCSVRAHVFVSEAFRVGVNPDYVGQGWIAEVYLNIPIFPPDDPDEPDTGTLLVAEEYIADRLPDFTFRTYWVDFPDGPEAIGNDSDYETIGDFLAGNSFNVSDPAMLDEPFGTFVIKFKGYLKVEFEDDTTDLGLPVWIDFGTFGYDAYRLEVGETIYRWPLVPVEDFFWRENPICEAVGLFPITVTYMNRHDPTGEYGFPWAGIEVYTWHGSIRAWPTGERMIHPTRGPGSIIPRRVIYQAEDVIPVSPGDFNADGIVDLRDARWFQYCFSGSSDGGFLPIRAGCLQFDFDGDRDIDLDDLATFDVVFDGPE